MDAGEVVIHEVESDGGDVMLDLFAEGIVSRANRRMPIPIERFARST